MTKKILENQLKRALADYQNLKKRVETDRSEFIKYAASTLIINLLTVLDDLERSQAHLQDQGLKLTIDKFKAVLQAEGLTEIQLLNLPFNPQTAECAELVLGPKDKVIEVITKGYLLGGQTLRPARVKVGNGVADPERQSKDINNKETSLKGE